MPGHFRIVLASAYIYDNYCKGLAGRVIAMKHGRVLGKLARNPIKRVRLLKNLATYLFEHESIQTTMARARELKRFSEKLITLAKRGTEPSQIKVFEHITKPAVGSKLITELAERYKERPGGYTRIWNAGLRPSDKAPIAIIELVDNPSDMKKAFQKYAQEKDSRPASNADII